MHPLFGVTPLGEFVAESPGPRRDSPGEFVLRGERPAARGGGVGLSTGKGHVDGNQKNPRKKKKHRLWDVFGNLVVLK